MRHSVALVLSVFLMASFTSAATGPSTDIGKHAHDAQSVVVATVLHTAARFDRNRFGDQLIMSQVFLEVNESLKGGQSGVISLDVEGGTIGDLTLTVSDLPALKAGDRAVFFLDRQQSGLFQPHERGHGILKLDRGDRVSGSTLTLNDIRAAVARATQR